MQLTFLGKPYEASFPACECSDANETGAFLGKQYTRKQVHITHYRQPAVELTFLGQRYIR